MNLELGDAYAYVERFAPMSCMTWDQFAKWLRINARIIEIQSELSSDKYEDAQTLDEWLEEIR